MIPKPQSLWKRISVIDRWKRWRKKNSRDRPAKPTSSKTIAALYWDIHAVCQFRSIVAGDPSEEDSQIYDQMCRDTQSFIDKTLSDYVNRPSAADRSMKMIKRLGWKIFAICAHSEAFRRTCTAEGRKWSRFWLRVKPNRRSLEVFARAYKLEWRGPLLKHAQRELPGLRDALSPDINVAREHPHHTVQTLDQHLRRPRYNGKAQVHINQNIFDPSSALDGRNPTLRRQIWGPCGLCSSPTRCACIIGTLAGGMVELVEYKDRGVGVRALGNFKAGEILGEYSGVVEITHTGPDTMYLLRQGVFYTDESGNHKVRERLAEVDSVQFGGWTRFVNHSCDASLEFVYVLVGHCATTIVRAVRNIWTFEELTVDYGDGYWSSKGRRCLCGSGKCRFRNKAS